MNDSNNENLKVMLIDDDEFILDIYSRKFKDEGLNIKAFGGAKSALDQLTEEQFDIVLFDILMPKMDGIEFIRRVRDDNLAPNSTFIVLSNQGSSEDIKAAEQFGVDGYIVKASMVPSEVIKRMREIHGERQSSGQQPE